MKLAITCDWLTTFGGAEHVLAEFCSLWPEAPVFTTVQAKREFPFFKGKTGARTDGLLQRLYPLLGRHQPLLPLMPRAVERMNLDAFDVIVSSSHAVGKGIIPPSRSVHICYCHTPMRYAWEMEDQYLDDFGLTGALRWLAKSELRKLRRWDLSTAKRVDRFIANSTETQRRIQSIYGRESVVIPPPVEARFFEYPIFPHLPASSPEGGRGGLASPPPSGEGQGVGESYFLALGRLVPYKRFDLLIELANTHKLPLKIGGTGSEMEKLKNMAGPTIEFLGYVPEENLPALYGNAEALLSPQMEDAGIVPMEAQAVGLPVIAFGKGGILDIVEDARTGVLADAQTVEAFSAALARFRGHSWNKEDIRSRARRFHASAFRDRIAGEVQRTVERFGTAVATARAFGVQSIHA